MQLLMEHIGTVTAANVVDVAIMTCLVYFVASWLRGTRAFQILGTLAVLGIFYFTAVRLGLILTSILFQYLWAAIILVVVIVFQPEIREMLDRASPIRYLSGRRASQVRPEIIDEVVRAVADLATASTGALVVFQRTERLDRILTRGLDLDCAISAEALAMIFQKNSPLHDGAVLIAGDRIVAASCILPVSKTESIELHYGTRHRAALGLTERTDALCVVVSEERGEVSLVEGKQITSYKRKADFREALARGLALGKTDDVVVKSVFGLFFSNWKLKVLSVLTAMVLWFVVVGPRGSELGMTVPIQYTNLPPDMEIIGQWMDKVDVRLKGSEQALVNLKPGSVRAVLDLTGVVTGINYFRITSKNLQVPPGTAISEIRPTDLTLNIEEASTKKLSVVPTLVGALPENVRVNVTPAEVQVKAVQGDLKKITSVTTERVNISDLKTKGKVLVPVVVKPEGLSIDSIEPLYVTVSLEEPEKT